MYCSSCGRQVDAALSYCNQCGARLGNGPDPRDVPVGSSNFLLGVVIAMPFIGLAMIFGVIAALKNGMGFRDDFIFAVTFLTFLLFALAEVGCIVMLLTRTKRSGTDRASSGQRREIPGARTRELGPTSFEPMPVGSVTDHTTRTLEPVPQDREGR